MTFIPVALYTLTADFVGYAIKGPHKLQSTNIYAEDDRDALNEQLRRLNEDMVLRAHWPNPRDPEVLALTSDPTFMPLEYRDEQVVDEENSRYVFKQKPARDPETDQLIEVDSDELDRDASVLVWRTIKVPTSPSAMTERIKAACELVARKRTNL